AARGGRPPPGARPRRRPDALPLRSSEEGAGARRAGPRHHVGGLLVLLLLERLLARGEDATDLEVEVVRARRRLARRLVGDEALAVEPEQALVEGLHAVLRLALRDGRRDVGRPLGLADAVPDQPGADHHFDRGHAPLAADPRDQPLRDDTLDDGGELIADLLLLMRRKGAGDP